jgi:hypothetical protein
MMPQSDPSVTLSPVDIVSTVPPPRRHVTPSSLTASPMAPNAPSEAPAGPEAGSQRPWYHSIQRVSLSPMKHFRAGPPTACASKEPGAPRPKMRPSEAVAVLI